jgi:hypothetical protein
MKTAKAVRKTAALVYETDKTRAYEHMPDNTRLITHI